MASEHPPSQGREGSPTTWASPLCRPHRASPSEGVDVSLVVVAVAAETTQAISPPSLSSLFSDLVVFLVNESSLWLVLQWIDGIATRAI